MFDYITYTPSFATLSSMPLLNTTSATTSTTSTSLGNPSSQPSQAQSSSTSQPSPTAAIVGGVIGGLAFGVLVAILGTCLFLRRRKAKEPEFISQGLYTPTDERNGMLSIMSIIYSLSSELFLNSRCKQPQHTKFSWDAAASTATLRSTERDHFAFPAFKFTRPLWLDGREIWEAKPNSTCNRLSFDILARPTFE